MWKIAMPLYRRVEPNMQLLEFRCNEFVKEFMYGNLRKQQLVKHWEGDTMSVDITRKVPPGDSFYQWYGREHAQRRQFDANEACHSSQHHRSRPVGMVDFGLGTPRLCRGIRRE